MVVLNRQRLNQLKKFHPKISNLWYLIASVTASTCNKPQHIPIIYHYALQEEHTFDSNNPSLAEHVQESIINDKISNLIELQNDINILYRKPLEREFEITRRLRESLFLIAPIIGLPKSINALSELKKFTAESLNPKFDILKPMSVGCHDTSEVYDHANVLRNENYCDNEISLKNGVITWNETYGKVSNRVCNNLNSSYPDLWQYIIRDVYGKIFSFDKIIKKDEKSLVIISALIPQNVDAQLRGHLKGALNVGCDEETIEAVKNMSTLVCRWLEEY